MNDKNIEKSCVMEAPAAPARAHNSGNGAVVAVPGGAVLGVEEAGCRAAALAWRSA